MRANDAFDDATVRTVTTGLLFPEGPIACDDGSVLISEMEAAALTHVAPDGALRRIDCGGGPNGAAFGPDGAVYVANNGGLSFATTDGVRGPTGGAPDNPHGHGFLQRVDPATGVAETVFTHVGDERLGCLNDIVFDDTGCCYFVDTMGSGLVYADPLGGSISYLERDLALPNGMGLSPDGTQLYVTETYTGNVFVWDVVRPGELANKRALFRDADGHGWDGLAIDGAGNVCAANLKASGISVITPDGDEVARFRTPEYDPFVTNVCFGGPSGDTAYICSAGRGILYSVQWPWGGLRLNFAR